MKKIKLHEYLSKKRLQAGLTQSDVAKVLGYTSAQFISNWERGLSAPPMEVFKKLSKCYNISVDELFQVFLHESLRQVEENLTKQFAEYHNRKNLLRNIAQ